MLANMSIEIDKVDYLADVNSSEEGIMFALSFVMSGGNSLKRWMFDAGGEGHVELEVKVDSRADKLEGKERTKSIYKRVVCVG